MSDQKRVVELLDAFPLFSPNSAGEYNSLIQFAFQAVNQTFPALSSFTSIVGRKKATPTGYGALLLDKDADDAAVELKKLFDHHKSDKATLHDYHKLYGFILKDSKAIKGVLEIGLGTNNADVVSNMGGNGNPGASLRAFRDFLPNAAIYGADVDKRVLFEEDRIKTFFVDQTQPASFAELIRSTPSDLDLIIDDGLHSPHANIITLGFALSKIKAGGWVVIEDIRKEAQPLWEVVSALLSDNNQSYLLQTKTGAFLFAVRKSDK